MHWETTKRTEVVRHGRLWRVAPIAAAFAAVATPVVSSIAATGNDHAPRVGTTAAAHKRAELRVTAASAKLNEAGELTGTAAIVNSGSARARATTAGVAWKDSSTHGEVQLGKFAVPLLKPGQKHKASWHLKLPTSATAGTYAVEICADVLSQVQEASKKHLCHGAGSVVFNPKGGVKSYKPKEAPKTTTTPTETPKEEPKEAPKETPSGPPDTTITSGPSGAVATASATFDFTSTQPPSTFQCSLDASAWVACSSPQTYTGLVEGAHVFRVRAVNSLSELDLTPAEAKWTVETEPPVVGLAAPLNETFTNEATPLFDGTSSNGTNDSTTVTLKIYSGLTVDGPLVQTLETKGSTGSWATTPAKPLTEGTYTAQASQVDAADGVGVSNANTFTVKLVPPLVMLTEPPNATYTSKTKPTFAGATGTAVGDLPAITVNVYSGGAPTGTPTQTLTATASAGSWSATPTTALSPGEYTVQATQGDKAGNTGETGPATFTIKTTPPQVTLIEPTNGSTTNKSKPQFGGAAGTEPGASTTVEVNVYSGAAATGTPVQTLTTAASAGAWHVTPTTPLANGEYTAQAVQDDAAGNEGKSSADTFIVNTTAPTVTLTSPKNGTETNNTTPMFAGAAGTATGDLPIVTVNIYSGPITTGTPVETLAATKSGGTWSVQATTPLFNGEYTAQASQENEAGNVGVSTPVTFTVNTTPPAVTLTEPANGSVVGQSKPTLAGDAETTHGAASTVTVKIYTGTTTAGTPTQTLSAPVTTNDWTVTPTTALSDGTYTARATQIDEAGNEGKTSANTFTVETKAPGPVTGVGVADNTDSAITLSWTDPTGPDYQGVVVRRAVGSTPPSSPTEGTLVGETMGEAHEITDKDVTAGTTYSYALFAHNALKQYATAATITITAQETTGSCTDTWKGTTNKEWNEATNWSNGHVPSTSDWVCILSGAANLPVNLNTPQVVDGLTNAGELTINSSLELSDAKNPSTSTGTLTVNGTLELAKELEATTLGLNGELRGAGKVVIPRTGTLTDSGYASVGLGELLDNGATTVGAEHSLDVRAASKFVNKGTLTLAVGSSLTGDCGHAANATEPEVPNGELISSGTITANGRTETGASPVSLGGNNECLVTHDSGPLDAASGELRLGGDDYNVDTGATITGGAGATLNFQSTVSLNAALTTVTTPIVVTGAVAGSGDLVASSLNVAGTLNDTGTIKVGAGGTLGLEGAQIDAGELLNEGTASLPANDYAYVGEAAKLVNKGALSVGVSTTLYGGCGHEATPTEPAVANGEFVSSGSITASASGGTAEIGPNDYCLITHDSGSLNVASGELKLAGQTFNFETGSTVTGGTSTALVLESRTDFNAENTTLPAPVVVTGSVGGTGNVTADKLKLVGQLSDSGTWTVPSGGTLTLESGQVEAGELVNEGTATIPANDYAYVGPAAKFANKGALSLEAGASLYGGCGHEATATEPVVPNGEFVTSGSITTNGTTKTGSSPVSIGYPYNYCLVTHDRGSLKDASGELRLGGQTFNFDTGSTVTGGTGEKLILEDVVAFNAATTLPLPVVVTGETTGTGDIDASTSLKLNGTLDGTGTLTVPTAGTLTVEGGQVNAGELVNEGTATIPANDYAYVAPTAKLVNRGSLSMAVGSSLYGGCGHGATATEPEVPNGEFVTSGSITTNGTTKTGSSPVSIGYPYNYCLVTHDSGSLNVESGELRLGGQTFNFDTGSSVTGAITSQLVLEDVVAFNATNTTLPIPVVVTGETSGGGDIDATDSLKLSGALDSTGTTTVPGGGTLTLESGQVGAGELVNEGTATVPANDEPYVAQDAKLVNRASLGFAVGSGLYGGCGHEATPTEPAVANGEFVNTGALTTNGKTETGSSPVTIGYPYNYCLVTQDTGSLDVASGELKLGGSSYNFNTGSTVTGATTSQLVLEGTVTFNAATTTLPAPVVLTGSVDGGGNVNVTDSLKFTGYLGGAGAWTVGSKAALTMEGGNISGGQLVNEGGATVTPNTQPYVGEAAKLVNKGSFTMDVGSSLYGGCGHAATSTEPAVANGEFVSSGSITTNGKTETGASPITIGYPYNYCLVTNDSGALDVASGELRLGGSNYNFNTGSTVTGASTSLLNLQGTVSFNAANTTLPVPVVITGGTAGGGNVNATDSLKLPGDLDGTGTLTVPSGGSLVLEGGSIDSGVLVNEGSGSIPAENTPYVAEAAKLVNRGSLSMAVGSSLYGGCGHEATATEPAIPNGEFVSSGSITTNGKSETGARPVTIGYPYDYCLATQDSGSLNVASGELRLGGSAYNFNTGASVTGASSSVLTLQSTVNSQLSSTGGVGTVEVTGHLHAEHSLSLPHLVLSGQLELSPGAVVSAASSAAVEGEIELDGTGNFGRLNISGGVTLSSPSLYFTSLEYVPPCGATITAITAGSLAGGFNYVSGGNSLSEGSWETEATSTSAGAYRYCPPPPIPASQTYGGGSSLDSYNPSGYAAEPVNTATGAYNTEETDASMTGLGEPFTFTRSYTSSNPYSGPLGPGWTDSLNIFLTTNGSEVVLHSENGQETTYRPNGEGGYNAGPGARSVLATKSGGGWTLTRKDQERLTFDEAGQLITKDDRNGTGLTLTYNEAGQLTTVKDSAGREVKFTYNGAGLLATMALPLARTITYSYDASKQLTSVTDAAGGTTTYEYNAQGLLESVTNQDDARLVSNTYDGSGRVIEQTDALGKTAKFTYGEGETTYTDGNGHSWKYVYEDDALVEEVDPTGDVIRYAYDANLDRTAATDENGNTTTMTYNAAGDMLTRVSALDSTQSWTYDALNDVTSYTDGDGHKTTYTYDGHGNLITTTYADGSSASETHEPTTGAATSATDTLGHTTKYSYNSEGDETSMTSPLGEETTYGYDAAGRRTSMVSPRGNENGGEPSKFTTTYTYDADNRPLTVTDPDGHVTKTTYDNVGNRTSVTNPNGDTTFYVYNAQNELTSVTDPEGGTTSYAYDAVGNRTSMTTPLSEKTTYTYDADNRLTKTTNALGHATTYGYDSDGNRISIVDGTAASSKFTYNADNQLSSISYSDGTPTVEYRYDAAGNRTQMTDGTGTTVYTYDELNRLTAVNGPSGNFTYAYDTNGHVTSRGYPDGSVVAYTYDPDQRLATVTSGGQTTTYSYDGNSDLTQTKLPTGNGYTETTAYDPAGLTTSIADTSSKGTLTSFAYTYDTAGNPTKIVTATTTITYTYDKDGRLTNACYSSACSSGSYAYTYNADGSRTKLIDAAGTTTYAYDEGDELASTEGPGGKVSYKYDADGRRTATGSTTYTWNAANELTGLETASSMTTYAYDGAGNRVSATSDGTTTSYAYDTNNSAPELVLERNGSSTLRRYVWGEGLLAMTSGGHEYYVAHDAQGSVVALSSASGATEDTITYDPFGNVLTENASKDTPAIPLKYDAEYLDPTGLYHVGARQLDPTIGAFISTDPRATTPSQPAISPYVFVADQPTVLIDPTGEYSEGGSYSDATDAEINHYISVYAHNQAVVNSFAVTASGGSDIPAQTIAAGSSEEAGGANSLFDFAHAVYNFTQNGFESF